MHVLSITLMASVAMAHAQGGVHRRHKAELAAREAAADPTFGRLLGHDNIEQLLKGHSLLSLLKQHKAGSKEGTEYKAAPVASVVPKVSVVPSIPASYKKAEPSVIAVIPVPASVVARPVAASLVPSKLPSVLPSVLASTRPSFVAKNNVVASSAAAPSVVLSVRPSVVASVIPSVIPSLIPSVIPSAAPSSIKIEPKNNVVSVVPSQLQPSSILPSQILPSSIPAAIPSSAAAPAPKESEVPAPAASSIPAQRGPGPQPSADAAPAASATVDPNLVLVRPAGSWLNAVSASAAPPAVSEAPSAVPAAPASSSEEVVVVYQTVVVVPVEASQAPGTKRRVRRQF